MLPLVAAVAEGAIPPESQLAQYGVLGIVFVGLAAWYIRKDLQCERQYKEALAAEQACREEMSKLQEGFLVKQYELAEKYRGAMETVASAMDTLADVVKGR